MFKMLQPLRWIIVRLVVVLFLVMIEGIVAGGWEVTSQLPTQRKAFSTAVVDGKIYLIGGTRFGNRRGPFGLSTVEVYDPQDNRWHRAADMPTPRAQPETAVVAGKIYVLGGYNGIDNRIVNIKTLKVVEVYDPQTDTWEKKQDMSLPRLYFGVGVVNNKIYAIGGEARLEDKNPGAPERLNLVAAYDADTDAWTKRAKMPTRRDGVETAVVNDSIYVFGGSGWPIADWGGPYLPTIEVYHPKINRWKKKPNMPTLKIGFSTIVIGGEIYLIGGHGGVGFRDYLTTVEVYNPKTERWNRITPMPTGNTPFGAAAVNGKIYILGSERGKRVLSPAVEVFDTGFRAVTVKGKLPTRWADLKVQRQEHSLRR